MQDVDKIKDIYIIIPKHSSKVQPLPDRVEIKTPHSVSKEDFNLNDTESINKCMQVLSKVYKLSQLPAAPPQQPASAALSAAVAQSFRRRRIDDYDEEEDSSGGQGMDVEEVSEASNHLITSCVSHWCVWLLCRKLKISTNLTAATTRWGLLAHRQQQQQQQQIQSILLLLRSQPLQQRLTLLLSQLQRSFLLLLSQLLQQRLLLKQISALRRLLVVKQNRQLPHRHLSMQARFRWIYQHLHQHLWITR